MITKQVKKAYSDEEAENFAGLYMDEKNYDLLITSDADIFDEDTGEPLLRFRKGVIPVNYAKDAYLALREAATPTDNRGISAGKVDPSKLPQGRPIGKRTKFRVYFKKEDGTLSNTNYANPVNSGIVGYFDRNPRFPYCRQTAFNEKKFQKFRKAYPLLKKLSDTFGELEPTRYTAQMEMILKTSPDFVIKGTAFTTVTVNKNWRTAVHKDAGDYEKGFGNLVVLQAGQYEGGYLVFPQYRVAVDVRSCDVLLMDVHQWHGNTEMKGKEGEWERISLVAYYRRNMIHCKSAKEESERSKRRQLGTRINDDKKNPEEDDGDENLRDVIAVPTGSDYAD